MHKGWTILGVLVLLMISLTACTTDDTANQTTSAQSLQPNLTGFTVEDADNVVETFANTIAAASAATGTVPLALTLERVSSTVECLTDVGAVSAKVYVQEGDVVVPQAGISLVVNQDRVERNLLGCVTELPFGAQTLSIEPCAQAGSFTYEGENFFYGYIGAGDQLCAGFSTHFQNYSPTVSSSL